MKAIGVFVFFRVRQPMEPESKSNMYIIFVKALIVLFLNISKYNTMFYSQTSVPTFDYSQTSFASNKINKKLYCILSVIKDVQTVK